MPVGLLKRLISISLPDSENIVEPMDGNVFDCCIRSPKFGPNKQALTITQFICLVIHLKS